MGVGETDRLLVGVTERETEGVSVRVLLAVLVAVGEWVRVDDGWMDGMDGISDE